MYPGSLKNINEKNRENSIVISIFSYVRHRISPEVFQVSYPNQHKGPLINFHVLHHPLIHVEWDHRHWYYLLSFHLQTTHMPKQCSRLSIMCLPILFLIWSSAAANSAASSNSCRFHITVSGAGTDSLNGVYYDETAELSDSVVYYYKWSAELNDWILLFRAADEDTG